MNLEISPPPANNGDAVEQYYLAVFQDGSRVNTIPVAGTSQAVRDLSTDSSYRFAVTADNKAGRSEASPQSEAVVPFGTPILPGTPTATLGSNSSGQADVGWTRSADFRGTGGYYRVQASNGATQTTTGTSTTMGGLSNFMGRSHNGTAVGVHTPDRLYTGSTWNIG